MKSMTGYGKAVVAGEGCELTVELKSVNHRFLDLNTKIPRAFIAHEDIIRSVLSEKLSRGHIDVFVKYIPNINEEKAVSADLGLAKGYIKASQELLEHFDLKNDFQLNALMRTQDIIKIEQKEDDAELLRDLLSSALKQAADGLIAMRQTEGSVLKNEITKRIGNIERNLEGIRTLAPEVSKDYKEKLQARISEVLEGVEIDQPRLLNEVAFFVDRSNIDEEIERLDCHLKNAREILDSNQANGRKLDFLIQEFNREANTICSKSNFVPLTNLALELKNEIEKIREQVQNIE